VHHQWLVKIKYFFLNIFVFILKIILEYLQGQTKELHIHIERISIDSIPSETNEQISNWLYQRFLIKDRLLKDFYNSNLNKKSVQAQSTLKPTIISCIFFLLTTVLLLITSLGRSIYWKIILFGTPIGFLWMHLFPPTKYN